MAKAARSAAEPAGATEAAAPTVTPAPIRAAPSPRSDRDREGGTRPQRSTPPRSPAVVRAPKRVSGRIQPRIVVAVRVPWIRIGPRHRRDGVAVDRHALQVSVLGFG